MIKKGAGSSGGMVSVQAKDKPAAAKPGVPMAALAGGGAVVVCVLGYLLFGGSSKEPSVAAAKAQDLKIAEAPVKKIEAEPKAMMAPADATPKNPVENVTRRDEIRPTEPAAPKAELRSIENSTRKQTDDKPAASTEKGAEKLDALTKDKPVEQAKRDAAKADDPAGVANLLDKREKNSAPGASDLPPDPSPLPAAPAAPGAPNDPPAALAKAPVPVNPLTDDTPDDPFNRDGTGGKKAAPATDKAAGTAKPNQAGDPAPKAPAAAPRAAFVRGKSCELFPAGTTSRTDEIVDPRNNKQTAKIDRYEGWIFNCQQLTGLVVKDGEVSINHQALLQLDRFPDLEYKLQFEMQLGGNSALAVQTGAAVAVSNLLIITDTAALPGTWDTAKTTNNVKGEDHAAKPHGVKDAWIPVQLSVHADSVDCIFGTKAPIRFALPKTATFAQLGFMTMGIKGNTNPTVKIRKATLYAP